VELWGGLLLLYGRGVADDQEGFIEMEHAYQKMSAPLISKLSGSGIQ
jgi:hypothetical protein